MMATLRHARYVLAENPVTGFAFAPVFAVRCCAPCSDRRSRPTIRSRATPPHALKAPSAAHWFGTDQLGRDIFSRVIVATRLDLGIAFASVVAGLRLRHRARASRRGISAAGSTASSAALIDTIMAFPLFVLAMGIVAALGNSVAEHRLRHRDHQPAALRPPGARRGQRPPRRRLCRGGAAVRQRRGAHRCLTHLLPNILPLMMVQVSLTMG